MRKILNRWQVVFLIVAVGAILTPVGAWLIFQDEIKSAFLSGGDEAIYWIIGTIGILVVFGLLSAYMLYNTAKNRAQRRSKILGSLLLPLLLVASVGSITYYGINLIPETRGPYLSWTQAPNSTMTIAWELKVAQTYTVQYGLSEINLGSSVQVSNLPIRPADGFYHYNVTLTGLMPDTRYYYQIPGLLDNPSSFKTAPNTKTGKFTFVLYGDSRESEKVLGNEHIPLAQQIKDTVGLDNLAFVINTGDIATTFDDVSSWNLHFFAIRELASHAPYMVASGNHEWDTNHNWIQDSQPANLIQEFPSQDLPAQGVGGLNETSFAFGYGAAYFIFLGYPHAGSNDTALMGWLENQIAIGNSSYRFTFVSFHRPPFDRREEGYNDATDIIQNQCWLFHLGGVDAVFNGHNHVLAQQNISWASDPNGRNVTYLISGAGGAPLRTPLYGTWNNAYGLGYNGQTIYAQGINHFFAIEVDGSAGTATFRCYGLDGNLVYTPFTLTAFK